MNPKQAVRKNIGQFWTIYAKRTELTTLKIRGGRQSRSSSKPKYRFIDTSSDLGILFS